PGNGSGGAGMRYPVSTSPVGEEVLGGGMGARIVGFPVGPCAPEDAGPRARKHADCVWMIASACAHVEVGGSGRGMARAGSVVARLEAGEEPAVGIDHADGMAGRTPI